MAWSGTTTLAATRARPRGAGVPECGVSECGVSECGEHWPADGILQPIQDVEHRVTVLLPVLERTPAQVGWRLPAPSASHLHALLLFPGLGPGVV